MFFVSQFAGDWFNDLINGDAIGIQSIPCTPII